MDAVGRFRRSANVNAIDATVPALSPPQTIPEDFSTRIFFRFVRPNVGTLCGCRPVLALRAALRKAHSLRIIFNFFRVLFLYRHVQRMKFALRTHFCERLRIPQALGSAHDDNNEGLHLPADVQPA
ncbi:MULTISPECIES: hypothetical protein [Paraburkholderia]|uniref:Uncharacterized protein n=1 Tax=Paraburkholderia ferrariae TaxID=386056 RepID=A0ABU9RZ79_9BURK